MPVKTVCSICLAALFGVHVSAQAPQRPPQQQSAAQEQPASLRGSVVNALTGEPIVGAQVKANNWGNEPRAFGALATAEGRFSITGMPPGQYNVNVERPGFTVPNDEKARAERQFTLRPGENRDDLKLRLVPCGAISGRVLDSAGEPVEFVQVNVEAAFVPGLVRTDEEGRFRAGGLAPGKYRVKAIPQQIPMPPEIRTDGTSETHHAPTYYPNSPAAKAAPRVTVRAGAETGGIEIHLVRAPIVRVSGSVAGVPAGNTNVRMEVIGDSGGRAAGTVKPDGAFEIWRLAPGKYSLAAVSMTTTGEQLRTAPVEVEVAGANVDGLMLSFGPPINITGRIEEDGSAPPQPEQAGRQGGAGTVRNFPRNIMLISTNRRGVGPGGSASIGADRTFTFKGVAPDRYRVNLNLPQGYVKSIRIGQVETEGATLDLRQVSGDTAMTIVVGYATGEISGSVRGDGEVAGTLVALMPDEGDFGMSRQMMNVGPDGAYTLRNVPPGKYKVIALDPSEVSAMYRSRDMDQYEGFVEVVELRAGEKATRDLKKYVEEEK